MTLLSGAIDACVLSAWLCAGVAGSDTVAAQVCRVLGRLCFNLAAALGVLEVVVWLWPLLQK